MKIAEKRNRNKMKKAKKEQDFKKEKKIYSSPNGPYRVISVVSLSGSSAPYFKEYVNENNGGVYFSEKHKTNFLFKITDGMEEIESSYICRASDIIVFFIENENINDEWLQLIKKYIPTVVFCISNNSLKHMAKKYVSKNFPKEKVVEMSGLIDFLSRATIKNSAICRRPYMVPTQCVVEGDQMFVEGYVKKGFLSDKVIVNGHFEMTIEEIQAGQNFLGKDLKDKNLNEENFKETTAANEEYNLKNIDDESLISDYEENNVESDTVSLISNEDELREDSDESEEEEEYDTEEDDEEHESLIKKYADYKGIRNISTCNFKSSEYPEHYKNLVFFEDFKRIERHIIKRESIIPNSSIIRMRLKCNQPINFRALVIFGCYECEDKKTIHNYYFEGKEAFTEENYYVDFGHKMMEVTPVLTNGRNHNVFKKMESIQVGVISFIAPVYFDLSRILIFKKTSLGLLASSTFLCMGHNGFYRDRIIFDEVVIKGYPAKVNKRSCIIKGMFHSKEEVMYYRNINITTKGKHKVTGIIKKPIGTKGVFKGFFSRALPSGKPVCLCLYKRAFIEDRSLMN